MATMGVAIGVRASVGKGEIRNEGRGKVRNEVEGGEGGEGYVLDWTVPVNAPFPSPSLSLSLSLSLYRCSHDNSATAIEISK